VIQNLSNIQEFDKTFYLLPLYNDPLKNKLCKTRSNFAKKQKTKNGKGCLHADYFAHVERLI